MKTVGKSGVTPCKHFLLNKLIGRELGVLGTRSVPGIASAYWIDLTAGDGVPTVGGSFERNCSPGIFSHHLAVACESGKIPVSFMACEQRKATYLALRRRVSSWYTDRGWACRDGYEFRRPGYSATFLNVDSRVVQTDFYESQAVFLYNDPNHINDWCLNGDLLERCPSFTTSLSTLGCNVGGLKRLELDRRKQWFDRVNALMKITQSWHDACLFSIEGASQWAYLITAPSKWRDVITKNCEQAAASVKKTTSELVWRGESPGRFESEQRRLFLTTEERCGRS